jgi:hypothetical protein
MRNELLTHFYLRFTDKYNIIIFLVPKEACYEATDFDVDAAHKYFSAECFNRAWDLIEKKDRSPEENDTMLALSMSSFWHWTQRSDRGAENCRSLIGNFPGSLCCWINLSMRSNMVSCV